MKLKPVRKGWQKFPDLSSRLDHKGALYISNVQLCVSVKS
jgi:hypothetical protein